MILSAWADEYDRRLREFNAHALTDAAPAGDPAPQHVIARGGKAIDCMGCGGHFVEELGGKKAVEVFCAHLPCLGTR